MWSCIQIYNMYTESINVDYGVKRRNLLSPLLFNLLNNVIVYLEYLHVLITQLLLNKRVI